MAPVAESATTECAASRFPASSIGCHNQTISRNRVEAVARNHSDLLKGTEIEVVAAANGGTAFRLVADQAIDIVLLDVEIRVLDGLEVCAAERVAESLAQPGGTRRNVPGSSTYLKPKGVGNKSMLEKREWLEDAESLVPRDSCDKAKATLPEPQSPAVEVHTRCYSV